MQKEYKCINKEYGSLMMESLIQYGYEHGFDVIKGNLSINDYEHMDRLHHFYEKFGFEIILFDDIKDGYYYGEICLNLKNNKEEVSSGYIGN